MISHEAALALDVLSGFFPLAIGLWIGGSHPARPA